MIRQFTKDFRIIHNADRLAERIFLLITLAFVAFILVASLTPSSSYHPLTASVLKRLVSLTASDSLYARDLGDISANFFFYIPLGLFLSLVVSFRKPRFLTPWLAAGFALSAVIEVVQYFVARYPDRTDLIANTAGYIFGFEIAVFAIKYFGLRPSAVIGVNPDDQTSTKLNTIASIRFFYIAVYLVSSLVPFDFSISPSAIYDKLNPDRYGQLRLILDPFYHLYRWGHDAHNMAGLLVGLLPVGILSAMMGGFRHKLHPTPPVLTCLSLAVACEAGQLFVRSRVSDIVMLPLAVMAGVLGSLFALAWFMLQDSSESSYFKGVRERNMFLWTLIAGYVLILILSTLSPYRFEYSLIAVEQKLFYQSNVVPFKSLLLVHNEDSSYALLRGIAAFIPLGLFSTFALQIYRPSLKRLSVIAVVGLVCMTLAAFLEILKVTGVGYYCDVTYIVLAGMGGVVGGVLFRLLSRTGSGFNII